MREQDIQKIPDEIRNSLFEYLKSDGPGGQKVIEAFMTEFQELEYRSPQNDPTNLKFHRDFIRQHVTSTWDESLRIDEAGNISIGVCNDEVLGFSGPKDRLKHRPTPIVWTVYLIRGIAGRYAFVGESEYIKRHGVPMPPQYAGGFLINSYDWHNESWDEYVGPFEQYEHPSSGASPIPFFRNVINRIDMRNIIDEAIKDAKLEVEYAAD